MSAVSFETSPDRDYIFERQTFVYGVPTMERRHPLQTHVWADDDIPTKSRKTAKSFSITGY